MAYEFPPSGSPQSLRWAYLAASLAESGVEVHVLTTNLRFPGAGLPQMPAGVVVHRVFAGPYLGVVNWLASRAKPQTYGSGAKPTAQRNSTASRVFGMFRHWLDRLWFPDVRSEWTPFARVRFAALVRRLSPNAVVGSHEPAASLRVSRMASEYGIPWIADLGDPIQAPYTAPQWLQRAFEFERDVCASAARVVVTADSTRDLLAQRHGLGAERLAVVSQGFPAYAPFPAQKTASEGPLRLLYSGRFYAFRDPQPLLDAVAAIEGVSLEIMGSLDADTIQRISRYPGEKIRYLGNLPHDEALAAQREADVLVNIGNSPALQVPGKIYEYFGSGRPVLHIEQDPNDVCSGLVRGLNRGLVSAYDQIAISGVLAELSQVGRAGFARRFDLSLERVQRYSWPVLARDYRAIIEAAVAEGAPSQTRGQK